MQRISRTHGHRAVDAVGKYEGDTGMQGESEVRSSSKHTARRGQGIADVGFFAFEDDLLSSVLL